MARWSPTVTPQFAGVSNAPIAEGVQNAGAMLLSALAARQQRTREDRRYKDSQQRYALEQQRAIDAQDVAEARQMDRDAKTDAQTQLLNALALQEKGYTTGPTAASKLATLANAPTVPDAPIPLSALGRAGQAMQERAPSVTMGQQTYTLDETQTPDAKAERRQLAMLGRQQDFTRDLTTQGQQFQREQAQNAQTFQAAEGAKSRAVTLAGLARDRYSMVPTASGLMRFNATTGQVEPVTMDGQPVAPAGARSAQSQANEAALYGSQMNAALNTLQSVKDSEKPFGLLTQAGLNQAGNGFTGDLLAGLGRGRLTPDEQRVQNARDQFAASAVYAFSGKTATNPEKATMRNIFFMQPGEEGDALARQKAGNREVASLAMQARTQGRTIDMAAAAQHLLSRGYREQEVRAILGAVAPLMANGQTGGQQP